MNTSYRSSLTGQLALVLLVLFLFVLFPQKVLADPPSGSPAASIQEEKKSADSPSAKDGKAAPEKKPADSASDSLSGTTPKDFSKTFQGSFYSDFSKFLSDYIDDAKEHRTVDFLVYEPIHVTDGGPANGNIDSVGFDSETTDSRDAILSVFKEVVDTHPWHLRYYSDRGPIKDFYDGLKSVTGKEGKLAFLKRKLEALNSSNASNHYETLVYAYMNDTEVTVFIYDITKPYDFHFGRKAFATGAGQEYRRSTVKNAFHDALVNAFGEPPL